VVLRWTALSAVLMSGALFTQALAPATVVLSTGEKLAGPLAFHLEPASVAGPSRGVLSLHPPGGRALTIPLDQVAVIDFAGGKPGAAELDALDADSPHVLVLRNGNVRRGRLVGIVDGEFVRWEVEGGAQVEIALRNVSRIYLQLPRARAGKAGKRSARD
jgi:hypothetical protein